MWRLLLVGWLGVGLAVLLAGPSRGMAEPQECGLDRCENSILQKKCVLEKDEGSVLDPPEAGEEERCPANGSAMADKFAAETAGFDWEVEPPPRNNIPMHEMYIVLASIAVALYLCKQK